MPFEPIDDVAVAREYAQRTGEILRSIDLEQVARAVAALRDARTRGATIFLLGNGGSASTASHFATDLTKATGRDGAPGVRALSLTDNVSLMTALSNDVSYEEVFTGQLDPLLRANDVVIAISASGESPNILRAVELARARKATTIALVGFDGGRLVRSVDIAIHVRSSRGEYGPVEDVHLAIHHMVAACLARG